MSLGLCILVFGYRFWVCGFGFLRVSYLYVIMFLIFGFLGLSGLGLGFEVLNLWVWCCLDFCLGI